MLTPPRHTGGVEVPGVPWVPSVCPAAAPPVRAAVRQNFGSRGTHVHTCTHACAHTTESGSRCVLRTRASDALAQPLPWPRAPTPSPAAHAPCRPRLEAPKLGGPSGSLPCRRCCRTTGVLCCPVRRRGGPAAAFSLTVCTRPEHVRKEGTPACASDDCLGHTYTTERAYAQLAHVTAQLTLGNLTEMK